ncbi:hypothetical protein [Microbacterium maritypicum]|uniref:Uncharacterized protein n=2 Tax=Microbacterium maritypicum TaxID=33918 RepID=A0ACD4B8C0_MICMQ|nr:hypothetical protein [Microbacterium liquefaciens]UTT53773.1 hypothetical protein NMQ05_04120 [Microbacterium liquefaciens]UTT53838.1 hypothetical protein NMQ05_04450 [Microbacterium liquefaciens]
MTINIETIAHPKQGIPVEAVKVTDAEMMREVRDSAWVDGQMSVLSYPSSVMGFIGGEPPRLMSARPVAVGDTIMKGPAGDFEVLSGGAA